MIQLIGHKQSKQQTIKLLKKNPQVSCLEKNSFCVSRPQKFVKHWLTMKNSVNGWEHWTCDFQRTTFPLSLERIHFKVVTRNALSDFILSPIADQQCGTKRLSIFGADYFSEIRDFSCVKIMLNSFQGEMIVNQFLSLRDDNSNAWRYVDTAFLGSGEKHIFHLFKVIRSYYCSISWSRHYQASREIKCLLRDASNSLIPSRPHFASNVHLPI